MNSLSELNNISAALITFIDQRSSGITLDRTEINYYNTFVADLTVSIFPPLNIIEVINPSIANVRYSLEIKSDQNPKLTSATITWNGLPSNIVISNQLTKYTVSGITSAYDWDMVKKYKLNLFSDYSSIPNWYIEGKVTYFDDALHRDVSYTWVDFDPRFFYIAEVKSNASLEVSEILNVTLFSSIFFNNFSTYIVGQRITPKTVIANLNSTFTLLGDVVKLLPNELLLDTRFVMTTEQIVIPPVRVNMQSTFTQTAEGNVFVIRSHMLVTSEISLIKTTHKWSMHANLSSLSLLELNPAIYHTYQMQANLVSSFIVQCIVNEQLETTILNLNSSFTMSVTAITDHIYNLDFAIPLDMNRYHDSSATVTYASMIPLFTDNMPYMDTGSASISMYSIYATPPTGRNKSINISWFSTSSAVLSSTRGGSTTNPTDLATIRTWNSSSDFPSTIYVYATKAGSSLTTEHIIRLEPRYIRLKSSFSRTIVSTRIRKATAAITSAFTTSIDAKSQHVYYVNINRDCITGSGSPAYSTMTQLFSTNIPYMDFLDPTTTDNYQLRFQTTSGTAIFRRNSTAIMTNNVTIELNPNSIFYNASAVTDIRAIYISSSANVKVYLNDVLYSQFNII